jgi:hypothetical protein
MGLLRNLFSTYHIFREIFCFLFQVLSLPLSSICGKGMGLLRNLFSPINLFRVQSVFFVWITPGTVKPDAYYFPLNIPVKMSIVTIVTTIRVFIYS